MYCDGEGFGKPSGKVNLVDRLMNERSVISSATCPRSSYLHGLGTHPLLFQTLGNVLHESALRTPERIAVKSMHENISITYQELFNKADALVYAFCSYGLERGDRVAIWSHNCIGWIVTLVATLRVGLIPVAINSSFELPELAYSLKKTQVKCLVIGDGLTGKKDYYGVLDELIPELGSSRPGQLDSKRFEYLEIVITMGNRKLPRLMNERSVISSATCPRSSYLHGLGTHPLLFQTLGNVLHESALRTPERIAVKSMHENISITYQELFNKADALVYAFCSYGLERGDRVAIWSHNCIGWIVTLVATLRVGLIPVAINSSFELPELAYSLKKTQVKCLVIGDGLTGKKDYYGVLDELIPELGSSRPGQLDSKRFEYLEIVITMGNRKLPGTVTLESLIRSYEGVGEDYISKHTQKVKPEDGSIMHFTSGTTGDPKAALISHFGLVNNIESIGRRLTLNETHHTVCVQVPIFHALGSVVTILTGLRYNVTLVLAGPIYSVRDNLATLTQERCSVLIGTPTMFVDLIAKVRDGTQTPTGLQIALTAGAPCTPQLIRDIQNYFNVKTIQNLYGMTEATASVFQSRTDEDIEHITETVGYIQDHVEVKVVDDNGGIVPFGCPGELYVRGYNIMKQYWDDPQATKRAIDDDGWLKTGDFFVLREDGYGQIVGRKKDIIVRGGENIAPKEIEDLISTHPDVIEAQVVGVNNPRLGEEVCVALRLMPGTSLTLEYLRTWCTGHLAQYKLPTLLVILEDFPRTASGKVQKFKIRDMIHKGQLTLQTL